MILFFPLDAIFGDDMPYDSQEIGTSQNDDYKL